MTPAVPVSVIILSGGESKRFGGEPKALCRRGNRTFLERIISAVSGLRDFPVPEIVIVGGKHYRDIKAFIRRLPAKGIKVINNDKWEKGQFSSLRKGIKSLSGRTGPVLIWPCDIPFVRKSTVKKLLTRGRSADGKYIFIPSYIMRAGHPVLIKKSFITIILKEPASSRLDLCLKKNLKKIEYIPVSDRNILRDIDTKADLSLPGRLLDLKEAYERL